MKKLALFALAAVIASGCSARAPRQETEAADQQAAAQAQEQAKKEAGETVTFGETTTNEGTVPVQTQRQVVKTETVRQDIPTVVQSSNLADINRMTEQDFQALGLPAEQAANAVKFRNDSGGFKSVDDLARAPGIDQNWFNANRDKLGISSG